MNWFMLSLRNTFNFKGRARRREYGWFYLINALMGFLCEGFFDVADMLHLDFLILLVLDSIIIVFWLMMLWGLWLMIAGFSVTVRRIHDLGHSAWWILAPYGVALLSILVMLTAQEIGVILFSLSILVILGMTIYLIFKDGQPHPNQYGESPKAHQALPKNHLVN